MGGAWFLVGGVGWGVVGPGGLGGLGPARALSALLLAGLGRVWASGWFHIVLLAPAYRIHTNGPIGLLLLIVYFFKYVVLQML